MPVTLSEIINNADMSPQLRNALMALMPKFIKVNIGTPASVPTISSLAHSVTVNGVAVGDFVAAVKPTEQTGIVVGSCRVSAANTVIVTFVNPTAGGITPTASETYLILHAPAQLNNIINVIP